MTSLGVSARAGVRRLAAASLAGGRQRHILRTSPAHDVLLSRASQYRAMSSIFVTGHGWTGALGLGMEAMVDGEISDGSLVAGGEGTEELIELRRDALASGGGGGTDTTDGEPPIVTAAAAGWGHSAFIAQDASTGRSALYVAGRPQDFQTMLRLKRLPVFLRRYIVSNSLKYDDGTTRPDREIVKAARGTMARFVDTIMSAGTQERENMEKKGLDEVEIRYGLYPTPFQIELPDGDEPAVATDGKNHHVLAASAGLTAVIGKSGTLYTFGLNHRGQCGVGEKEMFNCWDPTPVAGLSMRPPPTGDEQDTDEEDDDEGETNTDDEVKKRKKGRAALKQDRPIVSVALGLQHGLALDEKGQLYSFGKGARGQLGVPSPGQNESRAISDIEYSAVPVTHFCAEYTMDAQLEWLNSDDKLVDVPKKHKLLSGDEAKVTRIACGLNHSAAITASNRAWIWGKNMLPYDASPGGDGIKSSKTGKFAEDATLPALVLGLPPGVAILDVACGSHHTAFLLADGSVYAIGVATDTVEPVYGGAVEIIPPDVIDMPPRQFTAHFDRTTVVGNHGDQVLEVQLWSHEELRDGAAFEPGWVDPLLTYLEDSGADENIERGVQHVHKGWMHTLVTTD
jgi:hypothetical protein